MGCFAYSRSEVDTGKPASTEGLIMSWMLGIGLSLAGPPVHACFHGTVVEFWAEQERNIIGMDATYKTCVSNTIATRYGVSYYGDRRYLYKGVTSSVRYQMNDVFSPYIGMGVLVGIGGKDIDTSADGLDNNRNGLVDEQGEKSTLLVASAFVYPEVGLAISAANGVGLTASAKRYYGTRFTGHVIYSLGITMSFARGW